MQSLIDNPLEWSRIPVSTPGAEGFRHLSRPLVALRSVELGRYHLSVSHRDRIPTWAELGLARDALLPEDAFLCIPFPPRSFWINHDSRVLHLWAFNDPELQEQFRWEGEEARRAGKGTPDDGGIPLEEVDCKACGLEPKDDSSWRNAGRHPKQKAPWNPEPPEPQEVVGAWNVLKERIQFEDQIDYEENKAEWDILNQHFATQEEE